MSLKRRTNRTGFFFFFNLLARSAFIRKKAFTESLPFPKLFPLAGYRSRRQPTGEAEKSSEEAKTVRMVTASGRFSTDVLKLRFLRTVVGAAAIYPSR